MGPGSPGAGRVLLELLSRGPATRSDLARRLGLSTPTLTRLTKPLVARGLVRETETTDPTTARAGRPGRPLAVVPEAARFVGVKISRDGLDGVVVDLSGRVLAHRRTGLRRRGLAAVARASGQLVERLTHGDAGVVSARIAIGGRVVDDRLVSAVSGFAWDDGDVVASLQAHTLVPVRLVNDVHAYLVAEQWLGSGRGSTSLLLVTVGVGVGCAYAVDGRVQPGQAGTAGLVGHWPLTATGPRCDLGHRGCSGGWLPSDQVLARVTDVCGRDVTMAEAVALARTVPDVAAVLRAAARQLGRLAALAAGVVGPDRVVLGGDGIDYVRFAEEAARAGFASVQDPSLPASHRPDLVIDPQTGFADWARGAAVAALADWVETVSDQAD